MKIEIFYIGKPRSRPANQLVAEYVQRLGRYCRIELKEIRSERDAPATKALRVALDPLGEHPTSEEFARWIESAGRDVAFFLGGAEGWSDDFRRTADRLLSLGRITLPHELARVVLAEQLYRAFTILRGHPYPR